MLMSQDAQGHGFNHVFNTFPAELRRNFKGKGHEVADLGRLLGMYSRWQRQVFPFCSYDDFIAKLDKLSSSAILKTELRRLRQDLLQLADDERCPEALPEVQAVQATQPAGAHAAVPARANSTPAPLPPARHVPQGQWAADDEFDDELANLQGGHIEDIAAMNVLDELEDMGRFEGSKWPQLVSSAQLDLSAELDLSRTSKSQHRVSRFTSRFTSSPRTHTQRRTF